MSTPPNYGDHERPLTRRELRELAERQAAEALNAQPVHTNQNIQEHRAPTQSEPVASTHPQQANFGHAAAPSAEASPTSPQQTYPTRTSVTRAQAQRLEGTPASFDAPAPALSERPVAQPSEQPVQVTRRSMHQQTSQISVPQVVPPTQATAVRMVDETGTMSKLVDPSDFDPTAQRPDPSVIAQPVARVSTLGATNASASPAGRSNLSGFMRQAPPSSQIPRVVQDDRGAWAAAPAQAVQEQSEKQNVVLPEWGQTSSPFAEFAARTQDASVPSFEPQRQVAASNLPPRSSAFGSPAGMTPSPVQEPQRSDQYVAPAWDAITSVDSTLPEDPTLVGVSANELLAAAGPSSGTVTNAASPFGVQRGTTLQGADARVSTEMPTQAMPFAVDESAQSAAPAETPPPTFQPAPVVQSTLPKLDVDLEDDLEDDLELDHSYTWLHYMILIAVAFVLGMVIWKVAIDKPAGAAEQTPEDTAAVWELTLTGDPLV